MRGHLGRKITAAFAIIISLSMGLVGLSSVPASASGAGDAQITGSGSSWAAVAIDQWIHDVQQQNLQVVFTPSGSQQGRQDFANGVTDFAVSDIGYQGTDPQTGTFDKSSRPYAYLPLVGGGTAFPYHVTVRGQRVENLRLSQLTLAKIFTDQITNWDNPEITADNNGVGLPSIPIIPVVHSEGAGTTYQFTDFLNSEFPSLWKGFSGRGTPIQEWPAGKGSQIPQNGSDNVMNFISSSAGQGSIGFDEYAYALQAGYPVANIENRAGYFVAPDQYNVAVALTRAQINNDKNASHCASLGFPTSPCYLLEKLNKVWEYSDARTYPLSSYSYLIEPTSPTDEANTAKRQTIVDYATWALCSGQGETGPIGYSPLPINLVKASFSQLGALHTADPKVVVKNPSADIAQCHNPTFDPSNPNVNLLAKIAPFPPACDKVGQGPCAAGVGIIRGNPTSNGKLPQQATSGPGVSAGTQGRGNSGSTGSSGAAGGTSAIVASRSSAKGTTARASTGVGVTGSSSSAAQGITSSGTQNGNGTTQQPRLVATNLASSGPGSYWIELVVAVGILVTLAVPPIMTRRLRGRPKKDKPKPKKDKPKTDDPQEGSPYE